MSSGSTSEWEVESGTPPQPPRRARRIRVKGKEGRRGLRREACAALRSGRVGGESRAARRSRGDQKGGGGNTIHVGSHGLVGEEGWRLAALQAAREGESSSPSSSGPAEEDWLAARGSMDPTGGGECAREGD